MLTAAVSAESSKKMVELYGHKYPVVKEECVGHVQRTFGTALRNYKKNIKMDGLRYRMEETLMEGVP